MTLRCALLRRVMLASVIVALSACATIPADDARRSLVAAERAFAAMSAERGIRAAFLASFADDGVGFEPAPFVLRDAWGARPAPAHPTERTLAWHPVIAGVARAGTLGFTAGPSRFVDTAGKLPSWDGVYFSVWRRGADGVWKVAADAGIVTPVRVSDADFGADPVVRASPTVVARTATLDAADAEASGGPAAFAAVLAPDARWHVNGRAPVVGRDAVVAARASEPRPLRFVTRGREVASSGDLGYSYGSFESAGTVAGHYLHVWTRGDDGGWRLLAAVHLAAS